MRHLSRFLSTFEAAHPEFGPAGRQKRVIFPVFCLLPRPRALNLNQPVDKMSHFLRFLSTSEASRPEFGSAFRQKSHIHPDFYVLPVNCWCNTGIQPDQDIDFCRCTVFFMLIRNFAKNKLFMPLQKCSATLIKKISQFLWYFKVVFVGFLSDNRVYFR